MSILLLAGTREARDLAIALGERQMRKTIVSLAGETVRQQPFPLPVRTGRFGGEDGLRRFIEEQQIALITDATHPFSTYSHTVQKVAAGCGVACLRLLRPAWPWRNGWQRAGSLKEAAKTLPSGCRALLATGRKSLRHFLDVEAGWLGLRVVDLPPEPEWGRCGVFLPLDIGATLEEEKKLIHKYGVTHLVAKNSGGMSGIAKLDAAESLGVQVLMVERPPAVSASTVATVDEAIAAIDSFFNDR